MSILQLGPLEFNSFELPSLISFGGAQQLAVHKLIGGARIIDALGRDDASLVWSGVLTGSDAADRARTLDALRVAGGVQILTWDAFCYSVVIAKLTMDFRNPWWIPYRISCTVQLDLAQGTTTVAPSASANVLADLASAGQLLSTVLSAQISTASSLVSTADPASAEAILAKVSESVGQQIQAAESNFQSNDVSQLTSQAGLLAQLQCAQGFLNRSTATFADLGA